jgi:four helix bundle protein
MIKTFSDLEVYRLSYQLSIDVFNLSKQFPESEKYSLTSQIIRSTRSVSANIAEGVSEGEHTKQNLGNF